jgi:hypothetical protein
MIGALVAGIAASFLWSPLIGMIVVGGGLALAGFVPRD